MKPQTHQPTSQPPLPHPPLGESPHDTQNAGDSRGTSTQEPVGATHLSQESLPKPREMVEVMNQSRSSSAYSWLWITVAVLITAALTLWVVSLF